MSGRGTTEHRADGGERRTYIAIDLKSFYASVECVDRGLDPLAAKLVVADESRTEKTICLAVTPALKALGIPGRARLFEVLEKVRREDIIVAPPQMARYMHFSAQIYKIYLRHVAPEDIHVYSIDEVFMDVTNYLRVRGETPVQMVRAILKEVLEETGITATAGIGTNLYLAKIAMDIVAKHMEADEFGARIAELDENSYRERLWGHRPITDFWRIGKGYAKKLASRGMYTMGDVARCSLGGPGDFYNEDLLFELFGVNAELLIDHAWGYEPCRIADIKGYRPASNSITSGQVLTEPYPHEKTRLIVHEMTDLLSLDLVSKGLVTDQLTLTVGYDIENLTDPVRRRAYKGEITVDYYGREVPRHAHGTANLEYTSSSKKIIAAMLELFDRIADPALLSRRVTVTANHIIPAEQAKKEESFEQLDLFSVRAPAAPYESGQTEEAREGSAAQGRPMNGEDPEREKRMQEAILAIKEKYGKNAVLKGMNLEEGATTAERNRQIGGHKA